MPRFQRRANHHETANCAFLTVPQSPIGQEPLALSALPNPSCDLQTTYPIMLNDKWTREVRESVSRATRSLQRAVSRVYDQSRDRIQSSALRDASLRNTWRGTPSICLANHKGCPLGLGEVISWIGSVRQL